MPGNAKLLLDVTPREVTPLPEKAFKMKVQDDDRDEEISTTDVGSSCSSDGESTASTLSLSARSVGPTLGLPRKNANRGRGFRGTPLETIPGTPIAATYLESGSLFSFSFPTSPSKAAKLAKEETGESDFPHECSADESELEGVRVSIEDLQQSVGNHALPPPLPRSPRRRSKWTNRVAATTHGQEGPVCSATMTSVSVNPFCTMPILRSKKRSRQAAVGLQERSPITSVMSGSLSTAPVKSRPRSPKRRMPQATAAAVMSDAETSEAPIFGTVPVALPQSPKKRAREALFASAKRDGVPLKVKITGPREAGLRNRLNPALPAKKKPVFAEFAGTEAAVALRRLEPGMPVKKCVPGFLLDEPPRAIRPPPGLVMAR